MPVIRKKSTPREIRTLIIAVVLNVAILGVVSFAVGAWFFGERWTDSLVGNFDLDGDRFIKVYRRESGTRRDANLRYEVVVNGRVVLPRNAAGTAFRPVSPGTNTNPREFSITPAERGNLIAVTDRRRDDEIVILHDFAGNQSWPAHGKDEQAGREIGRFLLRRLQREYPYFNAGGISSYRPTWVCSPDRALWLFTLPYSPSETDESRGGLRPIGDQSSSSLRRDVGTLRQQEGSDTLLGIQVWSARTRRACFIRTGFPCDDFDQRAAAAWISNDVLLLSFAPGATHAWQIDTEGGLRAVSLPVDDAIERQAGELRARALKVAPRSPTPSMLPIAERSTPSSGYLSRQPFRLDPAEPTAPPPD